MGAKFVFVHNDKVINYINKPCTVRLDRQHVLHFFHRNEMKGVTYLRLDGSVPAGSRIGIVNRSVTDGYVIAILFYIITQSLAHTCISTHILL